MLLSTFEPGRTKSRFALKAPYIKFDVFCFIQCMANCTLSKDSDLFGYPPSLARILAVGMKKIWVLSPH